VLKRHLPLWLGIILILAGFALLVLNWPRTPKPTRQFPEPLIPTARPSTKTVTPTPTLTLAQTPTPFSSSEQPLSPTPTLTLAPISTPSPFTGIEKISILWEGKPRWGVGVAIGPISRYNIKPLKLGWYLDWRARPDPPRPEGIEYVQMVRLRGGKLTPGLGKISQIAKSNPGSLWLIGNEPDVKWQDNVSPALYAKLYHQAYKAIKSADPTAKVAIGGVSQPTPLRLKYLELILQAYREQFGEEIPVDVWNVHNFILREERGSWGVDIPPGIEEDRGELYEVDDSGNIEAFRRHIVNFRRWMAEHGFQNYPLIVSEYGIPMPEDYGFPPERVTAFLRDTFEFFLTAKDPFLGYPADDHRLVQRWCWYSLDDVTYPTGRLFDPQTGAMTAVGAGWADMVAQWTGGEK